MTWKDLEKELKGLKDPYRKEGESRYFKTGKGEYGEGDIFWGVGVPKLRKLAKKYFALDLKNLQNLLNSRIHCFRQTALIILNNKYKKSNHRGKKLIADFYLRNTRNVNNWDLVDISAPNILGDWLLDKDRTILYKLVKSKNLWERRVAVMATFAFIRDNEFADSLKIAEILLTDSHDLIHKAVGWMLREIGKRNMKVEEKFLRKYAPKMPRTMLRYAIEKFPEKKRQYYLKNID